MLVKLLVSRGLDKRNEEIKKIFLSFFPDIDIKKHPDILYIEAGEKLGVEKIKQIKSHLVDKPFLANNRAVVIENASVLTLEAQNALLKTFEEPPETAVLVLGINSEEDLIPTVLSRCQIVRLEDTVLEEFDSSNIENLLNSSIPERFEYVEKLKDKEKFLKELTSFYHQRLLDSPTAKTKAYLDKLLLAQTWANSNVNLRAILEYLMLVLTV